jgi:hypothetical protein
MRRNDARKLRNENPKKKKPDLLRSVLKLKPLANGSDNCSCNLRAWTMMILRTTTMVHRISLHKALHLLLAKSYHERPHLQQHLRLQHPLYHDRTARRHLPLLVLRHRQ